MDQTKMTIEIASYQRNLEVQNKLYQKDLEALLEKRSQENKELITMYETIVDNSLMGLTIMQDDKFVFVNARTAQIFGCPLEVFLSYSVTNIVELIHPEDQGKMSFLLQSELPDGMAIKRRVRIYTSDQQLKHLEASFRMVWFKGKPALHQTFLDITDFF